MNGPLGVNAERGTQQLLAEAMQLLAQALGSRGARADITCLNTVYYLPIALGMLAKPVQKVGDLQAIYDHASRSEDRGQAALLAAEVVEALRPADGHFLSPISDLQIHAWGLRLADGRMPGMALLLGRATNPAAAWQVVEELRSRNVLCLLGRGVQAQLSEGAHEPVDSDQVIALGEHPSSAVHGLGVAVRCAMKLGGLLPGSSVEIVDYCKQQMPGFVLALGGLDEQDYAIARGAERLGFPLIESQGGAEDARDLADQCMAARGLKQKVFAVDLPVRYGPAFEQEAVPDEDLHIHFGGQDCRSVTLLQVDAPEAVSDGRVEVLGPELPSRVQRASASLGIVVRVAGPKLQGDYEPYLERQIAEYINYMEGVQCGDSPTGMVLRISKAAAASGLDLQSIGRMLHARFHQEFPAAIEKLDVSLITDPACLAEWLDKAHLAHARRAERLAALTDDQVDVFYACTNCRPIAPRNVSIISPERVSPCGQCTWLDAKAAFELGASGTRRAVSPGKAIDAQKGIWEGTNEYARSASQGRIQQIALYSIMDAPMPACADFECMAVLIPEANGVMVLSREDSLLATPAGLTVETFASLSAGEQIPGVVGMGRLHLLSRKFLAPEGGFKRVVWMSSSLKDALREELRSVCSREGVPDLMEKIADERQVTTAQELASWLQEHDHPAIHMTRMF